MTGYRRKMVHRSIPHRYSPAGRGTLHHPRCCRCIRRTSSATAPTSLQYIDHAEFAHARQSRAAMTPADRSLDRTRSVDPVRFPGLLLCGAATADPTALRPILAALAGLMLVIGYLAVLAARPSVPRAMPTWLPVVGPAQLQVTIAVISVVLSRPGWRRWRNPATTVRTGAPC